MVDADRSHYRKHPTRYSRCRRLWAMARRPEMALRMTVELRPEDLDPHWFDYAVTSGVSGAWLMNRSMALKADREQRWPS